MSQEADARDTRYRGVTGSEGTPQDHFQTSGVITMSAGHGVHDTYTGFVPPLLPTFISNLAISKAQAGLLAVFLQAPSLIQPVIGHLADRHNLRFLVIMAPAVAATLMTLMGFAPSYVLLALLLTVVGLSSAGLHAVGPVMAGRLSGSSLGRGMSLWMVGGELGRTLGPIVVVTAVLHLGLRGLPRLMVAGWAASLVYAVRLRGVSSYHQEVERRLPWQPALRKMSPILLPLAGIILLRAFMHVSLTIYLPTFLIEEGADLWFAGAALSILQAAGVAGALLGGSVSDRLGRRTALLISMATAPAFMLLFLSVGGLEQIILLVVLGLLVISTTPVIMALVQESFPHNRALANGIYQSLSFVLRSGVIVVIGALGDTLGLRQAFLASAGMMFLGLPLLLLLPNSRQRAQ